MKTILVLLTVFAFTLSAAAQGSMQNQKMQNKEGKKYCATTRDGKLVVMADGKPLSTDVTLKNGTKISPSGAVVKTGGAQTTLASGQCVDKDGMLVLEGNTGEVKPGELTPAPEK